MWSCELRWVAAVAPCSVTDEDWPVQSCRIHSCIQMSCRLMERELCPERRRRYSNAAVDFCPIRAD